MYTCVLINHLSGIELLNKKINSRLAWKLSFNYWTGATRKDFATVGSSWCPGNIEVESPWGIANEKDVALFGKSDCLAISITKNTTAMGNIFRAKMVYRNCSQRQMLACRVHITLLCKRYNFIQQNKF
jgi:hypothetical protein